MPSQLATLTDGQLDAAWRRAGRADDRSTIEPVERDHDGDSTCRQIVSRSARDVEIYAAVVR